MSNCPLDPEYSISVTEDTTGSLDHRIKTIHANRKGTISTIHRGASYSQIVTNTMYNHKKGSTNTNLHHFQAAMVYSQQTASSKVIQHSNSNSLPFTYYHSTSPDCIISIPEVVLIEDAHWNQGSFPTIETPIMYITDDRWAPITGNIHTLATSDR